MPQQVNLREISTCRWLTVLAFKDYLPSVIGMASASNRFLADLSEQDLYLFRLPA